MKKITLLLGVFMATTFAKAQGLEGIVVEKYYQANVADSVNAASNGAVVPLEVGAITYRVYADLAPSYKIFALLGNEKHQLKISSTKNFYNDPNNGVKYYNGTSLNNIKKNTTMIDSYFTLGGVATGKVGVLKTEDTDGSVGNTQSILANTLGGDFGLPINGTNAVDGMISGTPLDISLLLDPLENIDLFDQVAGKSFISKNFAVSHLGNVKGPTSTNKVLLGQFTTKGDFDFEFNVQIVDTVTSLPEIYVANTPGSFVYSQSLTIQEQTIPGLTGHFAAPTTPTPNTSGIGETELQKTSVSIFPNPVKDVFSINIENAKEFGSNFYTIQDITGTTVSTHKLEVSSKDYTKKVDVSTLPTGVYFVTVSLDNAVTTSKIVKQ